MARGAIPQLLLVAKGKNKIPRLRQEVFFAAVNMKPLNLCTEPLSRGVCLKGSIACKRTVGWQICFCLNNVPKSSC